MSRLLAWFQRHRLVLGIAALTYIPVILSSPGEVGADTKTYLYLDPGGVLSDARLLWDSDVALGTVTHQNIGYLWPMGPFYWVFETLGSPDWFAQRIWLGSLLSLPPWVSASCFACSTGPVLVWVSPWPPTG